MPWPSIVASTTRLEFGSQEIGTLSPPKMLVLTNTKDQLAEYTGFAVLLFSAFAVSSVFILRRRYPDEPRAFKAWGYPVAPALFAGAGLAALRTLHLRLNERWETAWAFGIGLVAVQLGAALHYMPLTPVRFGLALLGPVYALTILAVGLFCSVMWSNIFSLAIEGLGALKSQASSLLVIAILGGALLPPALGIVADRVGVHASYLVMAGLMVLFVVLLMWKGRAWLAQAFCIRCMVRIGIYGSVLALPGF